MLSDFSRQHGWRIVSLIYSIACFLLLFIPVFAVKELSMSVLCEGSTGNDNKSNDPTRVTIGDNVTRIGDSAFIFCNGLTTVVISKQDLNKGSDDELWWKTELEALFWYVSAQTHCRLQWCKRNPNQIL